MELIIYNQQENPELIQFNHEELKRELTEKLGHYNSLVYTESEIKTAKTDRATLNKFKDAIEKRRKEIKDQCLKPYEDFETKVKEIVKMIDQPILAIDGQVKKFEEKVKVEKRAEIEAIYTESIGDLSTLLPLSKIWNEKWMNATVTVKSAKDEILETVSRVNNDLKVISDLHSEFEFQVKDVYLKTLNLSSALAEKTRLEDQKARQEAYDKAQAEKAEERRLLSEKIRREADEAREQKVEIAAEFVPIPEDIKKQFIEPEIIEPEPLKQIDFRVWATSEQLGLLKAFLLENSIKYGKVC